MRTFEDGQKIKHILGPAPLETYYDVGKPLNASDYNRVASIVVSMELGMGSRKIQCQVYLYLHHI